MSAADGLFTDVVDSVVGQDGLTRASNKATIWRCRAAYQNDFAARMQWSVQSSYRNAPHNPDLVVNGVRGKDPLKLTVHAGDLVEVSTAGSTQPDGHPLQYRWWPYREVTWRIPPDPPILEGEVGPILRLSAPAVARETEYHIVLEAHDDRASSMTSYRRVIITVMPAHP